MPAFASVGLEAARTKADARGIPVLNPIAPNVPVKAFGVAAVIATSSRALREAIQQIAAARRAETIPLNPYRSWPMAAPMHPPTAMTTDNIRQQPATSRRDGGCGGGFGVRGTAGDEVFDPEVTICDPGITLSAASSGSLTFYELGGRGVLLDGILVGGALTTASRATIPIVSPRANPARVNTCVPNRLSSQVPPSPGSTITATIAKIRETHSIAVAVAFACWAI